MWLSATGPMGNGSGSSATNAADASSQAKYDALYIGMNGTRFDYLPGTYQTKGWLFQTRQACGVGTHHFGAGIDVTTIQLIGASSATGDGVIFGNDQSPGVSSDNFGLHNMTLDCNALNQPKWSGAPGFVAGVQTVGNNVIIEHVKIINWGSSSSAEVFPIAIFAGSGFTSKTFNNVVVASCIITQPVRGNGGGSGCSCIAVTGSQANSNVVNAFIIGCQCIAINTDFSYAHGVGGPYCAGNTMIGCATAIYFEPSDNQGNFTCSGNTAINCSQGCAIKWDDTATAGIGTFTFTGNQIVLPTSGGTGLLIDDTGLSVNHPQIATLFIQDNFITVPQGNPPASNIGINLNSPSGKYGITNCFIQRNAFPRSLSQVINTNNPQIANLVIQNNVIDQ